MQEQNQTALATRDNNTALPIKSIDELRAVGQVFARSGMFGCDTEEKGMVLAMTCHMQRMTPMDFIQTYHIVEGKPSMRADAMLARFLELGGSYEVVARSPERAAITAKFRTATVTSTLSWQEAMLEPFPYTGKTDAKGDKILKKNWATPRARMQMLWARVVSDAVRIVCPLVNRGSYTPEETQDFVQDEPTAPQRSTPVPAAMAVDVVSKMTGTTVPVEVLPNEPAPEPAKPATPTPPAPAPVNFDLMPCGKQRGTAFADMTDQQLARCSSLTPYDAAKKAGVEGWTEQHKARVLAEIENRKVKAAKPVEAA